MPSPPAASIASIAPRAAVGCGAASRRDQHARGAPRGGGRDQLSGTGAAGGLGIALGLGHQPQARGLGDLDHGGAPVCEAGVARLERPPQRVVSGGGDELSAQRRQQGIHRPFAPVGRGQQGGVGAGLAQPAADRVGDLARGQRPLEGVGDD